MQDVKDNSARSFPAPCQGGGLAKSTTSCPGSRGDGGGSGPLGDENSSRWIPSAHADVRAGREFLDRFACLAVEGRPGPGVGILWSERQYGRQNVVMGFGSAAYQAQVSLARLGYTPPRRARGRRTSRFHSRSRARRTTCPRR